MLRGDKFCARCGQVATSSCDKCLNEGYCSKDCQKADWAAHKLSCRSKTTNTDDTLRMTDVQAMLPSEVPTAHQTAPKPHNVYTQRLDSIMTSILKCWEGIHTGMDGLRYESHSKHDTAFKVEQREVAAQRSDRVRCLQRWLQPPDKELVTHPDVVLAYWATRVKQNCAAINEALRAVLKCMHEAGCTHVQDTSGILFQLDSIVAVDLGVRPRLETFFTEPPYVTRIPSPDGEVFHYHLEVTSSTGASYVLDCAAAQYGMLSPTGEPWLILPKDEYLSLFQCCRPLPDGTVGGNKHALSSHTFTRHKVQQLVMLAADDLMLPECEPETSKLFESSSDSSDL